MALRAAGEGVLYTVCFFFRDITWWRSWLLHSTATEAGVVHMRRTMCAPCPAREPDNVDYRFSVL